MHPRDEALTPEALDLAPPEEEPESDELDAAAEMALLLDRVQAARLSGA